MGTKRKQTDTNGDERNNVIFPSPTSTFDQQSASVVRSTRDEKPVHYTLKIQSFSLLKSALAASRRHRYETQDFDAGGYKWKLALYPAGDENQNASGHISLYLVTAENKILSTPSEVKVVFTFLVYDKLRDKYLAIQDGKIRRFSAMRTEWGFEKLVSLDTFNDASNGFLVDDCCAFGVDIFVMKLDGKGEALSLIKQPKYNKFTWKLNKFSQLDKDFYESEPFTVEGYSWKISLYPKGCPDAMTGFLSLYLIFDSFEELTEGSQVYIEYEMAILSQLGMGPSSKAPYNFWFDFDGEDDSCGDSDFISLSDLKEPANGFIYDDTLIVEAKINVVSALKKFL